MPTGLSYENNNRDFIFIIYPFRAGSRAEVPEIGHTTFFFFPLTIFTGFHKYNMNVAISAIDATKIKII